MTTPYQAYLNKRKEIKRLERDIPKQEEYMHHVWSNGAAALGKHVQENIATMTARLQATMVEVIEMYEQLSDVDQARVLLVHMK
jgi:hypothetical protein